jgi:hypothetical protein
VHRTLSPQMVALFWEVLETLGDGACLKEVGHWGVSLEVVPGPSPFLTPCPS